MAKAILVIDEMPNCCNECEFRVYVNDGDLYCKRKNKLVQNNAFFEQNIPKPSWCPLRPMPERRLVHYTDPLFGEVENIANIGYNKCVDEIEGETE